jgi:hypothetical protein
MFSRTCRTGGSSTRLIALMSGISRRTYAEEDQRWAKNKKRLEIDGHLESSRRTLRWWVRGGDVRSSQQK